MSLDFEYWTDPLCIWAFVGQAKLDKVLLTWGDSLHVRYRVIPIFGDIPGRFAEGGKWAKQGREGRAATTRRIAREHAGVDLKGEVWHEPALSSSWITGEAIKAVSLLEDEGALPEGSLVAYQNTIRIWFFEEDRVMTRRRELLEAAEACRLDPDLVRGRLDDGRATAALWRDHVDCQDQKLRGSPTYVFDGGRAVIYGNFDLEVLEKTIEALLHGEELGGTRC